MPALQPKILKTWKESKKVPSKSFKKKKYINYNQACELVSSDALKDRRQQLCLAFAQKSAKNASLYFEKNSKLHTMQTRNMEAYKVTHCNTDRLRKSAIPLMQQLLNKHST